MHYFENESLLLHNCRQGTPETLVTDAACNVLLGIKVLNQQDKGECPAYVVNLSHSVLYIRSYKFVPTDEVLV